jgi:hypothetical protein
VKSRAADGADADADADADETASVCEGQSGVIVSLTGISAVVQFKTAAAASSSSSAAAAAAATELRSWTSAAAPDGRIYYQNRCGVSVLNACFLLPHLRLRTHRSYDAAKHGQLSGICRISCFGSSSSNSSSSSTPTIPPTSPSSHCASSDLPLPPPLLACTQALQLLFTASCNRH